MGKETNSPENAVSEIEAALRSMETLASKPAPGGKPARSKDRQAESPAKVARPAAQANKARRSTGKTVLRWLTGIVAICVLPLLVLVRLSVWFYSDYGLWPWIAVLGGAAAAALVLVVVALILIRGVTGSFRTPKYLKRTMFALALVYCGYSAMFISASNVKSEQVQETYTSLHPSLRIALSTWILVDPELMITDAERKPEDYGRMGLPENERSLHLVTPSGYVQAVDLRTMGRPEWRNFLTTLYFKAMGFQVLRHLGTVDHLHVSLPKT